MRKAIWIIVVATVLSSCASGGMSVQQSFGKLYDDYNKYLRWNEFHKLSLYVSPSIRKEFKIRIDRAKDIKIVDIREVKMEYDEKKGMAVIDVEIDYYHTSSLQLRTIEDTEKWVYMDDDGIQVWRLVTLLPEFH